MADGASEESAGGSSHSRKSNIPVDDTSDGSNGQSADNAPQFTSRLSVKHVFDLVDGFDDYKKWLVNEIGFGGLLKLPMLQKLNLKFSAWTMNMVDVDSRAICISETKSIRFWVEDFHKVFGVPCGNRDVKGRDGDISQDSIDFLKASLGMNKAGAHSVRAAEEFLGRHIHEGSSKIEKDCFQIAFVIFSMGHLLAPSTKYDYCQIDFWGALASTENISQFNWCEYALQCVLDGVTRLKKDMMKRNTTINLSGCHIFLPVFFLLMTCPFCLF
jgi:hypothetical protein